MINVFDYIDYRVFLREFYESKKKEKVPDILKQDNIVMPGEGEVETNDNVDVDILIEMLESELLELTDLVKALLYSPDSPLIKEYEKRFYEKVAKNY